MAGLELILVRHGETDWNAAKIFRGHEDIRLNANGIAQADAVAAALEDKVFEAVYSSPLKRAVVTARRIAAPHEIGVRERPRFTDINFGTWQGRTEEQVKRIYPKLYDRWLAKPAGVRFPRGESVKKAWKRVNTELRELLVNHGIGTVVIVTHRIPLKLMTTYLLDRPLVDFNSVRHDPCAMSVFDIQGTSYKPRLLNDTRHLAALGPGKREDF